MLPPVHAAAPGPGDRPDTARRNTPHCAGYGRISSDALDAWWPADEGGDEPGARLIALTDDRDWPNQIHAGRRWMHEGTLRER